MGGSSSEREWEKGIMTNGRGLWERWRGEGVCLSLEDWDSIEWKVRDDVFLTFQLPTVSAHACIPCCASVKKGVPCDMPPRRITWVFLSLSPRFQVHNRFRLSNVFDWTKPMMTLALEFFVCFSLFPSPAVKFVQNVVFGCAREANGKGQALMGRLSWKCATRIIL